MAATIARAIGRSKNAEREATRLGHESSEAQANTFKTFATAKMNADGSGFVQVEREIEGTRVSLGRVEFGPENVPSQGLAIASGGDVAEESAYAQSMREFDHQTNGGQF